MLTMKVLMAGALLAGAAADALRGSKKPKPAAGPLSWDEAWNEAELLVDRMTKEEKFSLLRGFGFDWGTGSPAGPGFYVGNIAGIPRLGVPALKMQDAAQGYRPTTAETQGTSTCWPSLLALASTWDEDLVREVASALGTEFRQKGANVVLGPSVNVHRSALGGRNFEYISGEDPYLGSRLAYAYVTGAQSQGVMACAKHWAFNEQETLRTTEDSMATPRTAWELYYPPFEAAIAAGVGSFMCSYNQVNGTYACGNSKLLKRDLRSMMGFQGLVMSDWGANHNAAGVLQGLDQELPGFPNASMSDVALSSMHEVFPGALDDAVKNVVTAIFHGGLQHDPGCELGEGCAALQSKDVSTAEHKELAGKAAAASVVLLKNQGGFLPIDSTQIRKITLLVDPLPADMQEYADVYMSGMGSGHVNASRPLLLPSQAIIKRASELGINVTVSNCSSVLGDAQDSDAVVVIAAVTTSEGADRPSLSLDNSSFPFPFAVNFVIPGPQCSDAVIPQLAKLKPTVALLSVPGAVLTPWRDQATAIAVQMLAGERTAQAWAGLLFGDIYPEGRLPVMFPESEKDVIPITDSLLVPYKEGLLTSYRSRTFQAAYPFGYGLSYTNFTLSEPKSLPVKECKGRTVAFAGDLQACLELTVTNVGSMPGKEVVQAYVHFPEQFQDDQRSNESPEMVMKGFAKTRLLTPGEDERLLFAFTDRDFSMYDVELGGWLMMGQVEIRFGTSSGHIEHVIRGGSKQDEGAF